MKGDRIPDEHHVARHCSPTKAPENPNDGKRYPIGEAFRPRPDEVEGVSTTWIEFFPGTMEQRIEAVREVIVRTRTVRKYHQLAIAQVAKVRESGAAFDVQLAVIHDPIDAPQDKMNPAHACIVGIPDNATELLDRIAAESVALAAALGDPTTEL